MELDLEWQSFLENDELPDYKKIDSVVREEVNDEPKCSDIYISTKTKISYLNQKINLNDVFWKINLIKYSEYKEGVIKKQMKFNSLSKEELEENLSKIKPTDIVENHIINHIENPDGRIKFKDVRKISIGLSNKDIISCRRKKRGAFYNCFVVILRIKLNEKYKEVHIKVFNTGKLEIPGIQNDEMLTKALDLLVNELKSISEISEELTYLSEKNETVLINSNFNCGYFINRDKLYNKLRYDYNIHCAYDPCSYPGIQCEFYYNNEVEKQTGIQPIQQNDKDGIIKVSFMIFRTGSVLIVGKCTENILEEIYTYLKTLFKKEYINISSNIDISSSLKQKKNASSRKKILYTFYKS